MHYSDRLLAAANKPAGKLLVIAALIDEAADAVEGLEPAYGLRIQTKHPPVDALAVERQAVWFDQFDPDDNPVYFTYLGVKQEGAPKALARQSAIGSAALVLHGIIGDALAQTEIDRIVDALAGAVFPGGSRPGVQEVRRWRLTFAEMRGVA